MLPREAVNPASVCIYGRNSPNIFGHVSLRVVQKEARNKTRVRLINKKNVFIDKETQNNYPNKPTKHKHTFIIPTNNGCLQINILVAARESAVHGKVRVSTWVKHIS